MQHVVKEKGRADMDDIKKNIVEEYADGTIYNIENIPSGMFEFFIEKRREFKDGTCSWAIGVSPRINSWKGFVFKTIRGTREDAEARLDKIIREERELDEGKEAER